MKRLAVALFSLLAAATAHADSIKVVASNGVKAALDELAPQFERASGHKVAFEYGLAAVLTRQLEGGEAFDLAVLTSANIEGLAKQGKVDGATRAPVARSGTGFMVKAGAKKPDLGNADAVKRAVLAAKSLSWAKEGASGKIFLDAMQKLGVADQAKAKGNLGADGADAARKVGAGEAELGVLLVNEILAQKDKGVELAGPLPPELQSYLAFHAGVSSASKSAAAAKAFEKFITAPAGAAVFKAKGQEPG